MKTMLYSDAIHDAIQKEMRENPDVFMIGEDIGVVGGTFAVSHDLLDEFGPWRIRDTPIAEEAIMGITVGAAFAGMVPIAEIMFNDFTPTCMDYIVNQAAKFRYMYGGTVDMPMVVRVPYGGGASAGAQHSQCLEAMFAHVPGLKVAIPSTPNDALGLTIAAIRDKNPVIMYEHQMLYASEGPVMEEYEPIPLGVADVKKTGSDVTVVATGRCVTYALEAAEALEKEGISIEVVDPRTLYPLDKETIYESIRKTKKVVVVTEEVKRCGWSAEMAANIAEDLYDVLEKQIVRVGALNVPVPYTTNLENYVLPCVDDIVKAAKSIA